MQHQPPHLPPYKFQLINASSASIAVKLDAKNTHSLTGLPALISGSSSSPFMPVNDAAPKGAPAQATYVDSKGGKCEFVFTLNESELNVDAYPVTDGVSCDANVSGYYNAVLTMQHQDATQS